MKKLTAFFLALCLIGGMFLLAGCKKGNTPSDPSGSQPTGATTEDPTEEDYIELVPAIDYGGNDFIIVSPTRSWAETAMTASEMNGEAINDALFRRTLQVNKRLNINLVDRIVTSEVTSYVRNDIVSGSYEFGLFLVYPDQSLAMYQEGLFIDQNKVETLNFDNPWWEPTFNSEVNVGSAKYVTYNQSNLILYSGFYLYAFNKSIVESNELTSPYELVEDNEWTWDTAYKMMKDVATDVNGAGSSSTASGDTMGLVGHVNHCQNLILSSGETIAQRDDDGKLTYNGLTQRYINAFEKYTNYFIASPESALAGTSTGFAGYTSSGSLADYINYFNEGKALFLTTATSEISNLRYIATDYEIIFLSDDYKITTLISGSLISKIAANSIINLDGKIWCGSPMGVYCFDLQTQTETWYPMDYERYVG